MDKAELHSGLWLEKEPLKRLCLFSQLVGQALFEPLPMLEEALLIDPWHFHSSFRRGQFHRASSSVLIKPTFLEGHFNPLDYS